MKLNLRHLFFLSFLFFCFACRTKTKIEPVFRTEMQDAYSASTQLFSYIWSPGEFSKKENRKHILDLLDRLTQDFHRVEKLAGTAGKEPGFAVTLQINQELLQDASNRLARGEVTYANWRLRNISENCISCHARYAVPTDFVGAPPLVQDNSFDGQIAAAEFLFASRQFEKAAEAFYSLAESVGSLESGSRLALRGLQRWLMIQVRVKLSFSEAAEQLKNFLKKVSLRPEEAIIVGSWIKDLKALEKNRTSAKDSLAYAKNLLGDLSSEKSLPEEERSLVNTLRASGIIHETIHLTKNRRLALYLLALAYYHLPLDFLDVFKELYLEQVIREFSHTKESADAYKLYEALVESENTGSGGIHLDETEAQKLQELQLLAKPR